VNDRHLVIKALMMAVKRRCPDAGLLHHSDRGSPYASEDYQKQLDGNGIVCSMSGLGNCYDNAAMESWFSTFKFELGERFESYADAKEKTFDYIEVFYNQRRIHSSIGNISPADFERRHREAADLLVCPSASANAPRAGGPLTTGRTAVGVVGRYAEAGTL
jgi:putative transposase